MLASNSRAFLKILRVLVRAIAFQCKLARKLYRIYVCMYVYTYTYIHIYIYIHIVTYTYTLLKPKYEIHTKKSEIHTTSGSYHRYEMPNYQ